MFLSVPRLSAVGSSGSRPWGTSCGVIPDHKPSSNPRLAAAWPPESGHSSELQRLLATKEKGDHELNLLGVLQVLGRPQGAKIFERLFNRMYRTNIKVTFTPTR